MQSEQYYDVTKSILLIPVVGSDCDKASDVVGSDCIEASDVVHKKKE